MRRRYKIYLAGPITGCNDDQAKAWRRRVRLRWSGAFDFIDPTDPLRTPSDGFSVHDIVSSDEQAIADADAVLASMWKESIGTSIGVVLARRAGKPVVIIDRNYLNSNILGYWSDATDVSEDGAMEKLESLLEAQERLEIVVKKGQPQQEFRREKLARSIRRACADANKNDILVTAEIMPRLIRNLCSSDVVKEGVLHTSAIKQSILDTLKELETLRPEKFCGIRESWERHGAEIAAHEEELESLRLQIMRLGDEMEQYNDDAMVAEKNYQDAKQEKADLTARLREKEEQYLRLLQALEAKKNSGRVTQAIVAIDPVDALRTLFPEFELLEASAELLRAGSVTSLHSLTDALVGIRHGSLRSERFQSTDYWLEARVNLGRGAQIGRLYYRKHPERKDGYLVLLSADHARQEVQDKGLMRKHDQKPGT